MVVMVLLMMLASDNDTSYKLIPSLTGAEGTGFIIYGDAKANDLITRMYPAATDDMKKDTSRTFTARLALQIESSGTILKEPLLLKSSGVPRWDTTIIKTMRGWVFKPSTDSLRRDTVEFRYIAITPGKEETSVFKAPGQETFNPDAFTSVNEIIGTDENLYPPADSVVSNNITFTFTGEVGTNDLESYILPNLKESMKQKGIAYATAYFGITVADNGLINDVTVFKSSGKTAWDSELEKAMLQWRFKASYRSKREAEVIFVISAE